MSKIETAISDLKRYNNNYIKSDILKQTNEKIWEYPEFSEWPGSIGNHHSYKGGLVVHTEEVWRYALNTALNFEVDLDVLFTAILWHDLAKIWDYKANRINSLCEKVGEHSLLPYIHASTLKNCCSEFVPVELIPKAKSYTKDARLTQTQWEKTDYHANVHHITGSIAEFTRHALNLGLDRVTLEKVQHCIAGHHGYPEWRSPVTPKSLEAKILHHSDMLSAFHGGTKDGL